MNYPIVLVVACTAFLTLSCTFNYKETPEQGEKQPDMIFSQVILRRYDNTCLDIVANAKLLEMYDSEKIWVGKDISFTQYAYDAEKQKETMTGTAGLVLIEENFDTYYLGNSVFCHLIDDNYSVKSPALVLRRNEDLLAAPQDMVVTITHNDETKIEGQNFVANTRTKEYSFKKQISGFITITE